MHNPQLQHRPGNAEPQPQPQPGNAEHQLQPQPGNAEPQLRTPSPSTNPEWYSRGYLPHRHRIGLLQSITFRLADSLPQEKLQELRAQRELAELGHQALGTNHTVAERRKIEAWLDAGMGCCALRHPAMAAVVEDTLLKFDNQKYKLIAWCVMPNHVHVLIDPLISLKRIVQSWKSYTGRWAFAHCAELGLRAPKRATHNHCATEDSQNIFWMPDYWDRFIRNKDHLQNTIDYIHNNPVKAGLCPTPEQWQWSSANRPGNAEPQRK